MLRFTEDSAKYLEAATRELGLSRDEQESFIRQAEEYALMDGRTEILGCHMLGALASRVTTPDGRTIPHGVDMAQRIG